MTTVEEHEITIREFFDKLQDRLMTTSPETGEKVRRYSKDREMIATLKACFHLEDLDKTLPERNVIFQLLFILFYLRRGIYQVIQQDLKSAIYKEDCLRDFDILNDPNDFEKLK